MLNKREDITKSMRERLIMLRERKQVTQAVVAKETGISRTSIVAYESGNSIPDLEKLYALSEYYQVSCDYLLGKDEATTHETNDICKKTGLSQQSVEKLFSYAQSNDDDSFNLCFSINKLLENKSSDFLLAFARYVVVPNVDEHDFSDKLYADLYKGYYLWQTASTKYGRENELEGETIKIDDIIYHQLIRNFNNLIESIKNDETTTREYVKQKEESLKYEYKKAKVTDELLLPGWGFGERK